MVVNMHEYNSSSILVVLMYILSWQLEYNSLIGIITISKN